MEDRNENIVKKAKNTDDESFSLFNASNTGISHKKKTPNSKENVLAEGRLGYVSVSGENKEKFYRTTIYKLGGMLCLNIIIVNILTYIISYVFAVIGLNLNTASDLGYLLIWLINGFFVYFIPVLIIHFIFRYEIIPEKFAKQHEIKRYMIVPIFFAVYFAMTAGSYVTEVISSVLYSSFGVGQTVDVYADLLPQSVFQTVVFYIMSMLVAPVAEELIFRKMIFFPLRRFGDLSAILLTALFFALFHGNGTQFLYTFFCGLILGFSVVWSGSFYTSIILHILINSFEVFRLELYNLSEAGNLGISIQRLDLAFYAFIIIGAMSLIVLIAKGLFRLNDTCPEIERGRKISTVLVNPLLILALALMVLNLFI